MPMRATTVRFAGDLWELLEREAAAEGVSAAQFVRDATIMRIAFMMGRRGDSALETTLDRLTGERGQDTLGGRVREEADAVLAAVRDPGRLAALHETKLLDSPVDDGFDRYARLAAEVLGAPVALVSLVDADRQFFKSCLGLPEPWATRRGTPLSHSFCQHAIARREPLIIPDARRDPALRDNPAIRDLSVVAYAGVPLMNAAGHALGTLCVIDDRPREWPPHHIALLKDLAAAVVTQIELAGALERTGGNGNGDRAAGEAPGGPAPDAPA